jgi:hypothetical protein
VRGGGLARLAASSWATRCGGTSGDSSCRKRGRCRARWDRWRHTEAVARQRGIGLGLGRWCSGGRGAPVILEALSSYKGVNGGVRRGSYWSGMVRIHGSQVKVGAAASASKLAERGTVSGARETSRAIGTAGEDVRVLGLRQRVRKREELGTGGFKLMGTRGGEGEGNGGGGVRLCSRPRGENGGGVRFDLRVVSDVSWHGTDTAAQGCSDSCGRRTSRGHWLRTGEDGGVHDVGRRG